MSFPLCVAAAVPVAVVAVILIVSSMSCSLSLRGADNQKLV